MVEKELVIESKLSKLDCIDDILKNFDVLSKKMKSLSGALEAANSDVEGLNHLFKGVNRRIEALEEAYGEFEFTEPDGPLYNTLTRYNTRRDRMYAKNDLGQSPFYWEK